jgi:very-short-patch-repair endonuclease
MVATSRDTRGVLGFRAARLSVAVEYDGDQHRTDRRQYVKDIRRWEIVERLGWLVVRVVAEDRPHHIIQRVRDARARRM